MGGEDCRGRGIRSNEIPRTWVIERAYSVLVSRSLKLPAAPPDKPQALFNDFPCTQKKGEEERVSDFYWQKTAMFLQLPLARDAGLHMNSFHGNGSAASPTLLPYVTEKPEQT